MCGEEAAESKGVEGDWVNEECMGESHCSYRADPGVINPAREQEPGWRLDTSSPPLFVSAWAQRRLPGSHRLLSLVVVNPIPCFLRKPACKF